MKKLLILALAAMLIAACGGQPQEPAGNENAGAVESPAPERETPEPTEAEESPEDEADTSSETDDSEGAADKGPQRIRFEKGKSEGTVEVGLEPGAKKRFVIGVAMGQHLTIESEDFRPLIKMISKGMVTDEEADDGDARYYAVTVKGGDIIFEVENITRNSIKTNLTVSISDKVY